MLQKFKSYIGFYLILLTLFLSGIIIGCLEPSEKIQEEDKFAPNDYFFLQRAFPDASIDLVAYNDALIAAKESLASRSGEDTFDKEWRTEGPGNLGARVNTIAVHPDNEDIIFAGYSGGGVFRTMDGGKHWAPIFDEQLFLAIGDIVFDPNDANTIYVGTGDPNISGFPFLGDGLYKSTDLGNSWTYLGLAEQRIIAKILIHPDDSDIIYVATMGLPFEPNADRGLYKTTDGGQTWQQILFLGEATGVIDVVFDNESPTTLFAAGWDRLRNNQVSKTSGEGAKIYRSIDGGLNWELLSNGLPFGAQSRIGLATAADGIMAVYTDTQHRFRGLYKTTDDGDSWQAIATDEEANGFSPSIFGNFGWYFSKVRVHPENPADITVLGVIAYRTVDGGQNWRPIRGDSEVSVHADAHDLVYTASGKMILGTDGGMYSFDQKGVVFEDIENIPATQIYRVAYNPHAPQDYFMGSQDNGLARGNATSINGWERFKWGGDGFQMAFHPDDPAIFYVESQRGGIGVTLDGGENYLNGKVGIDPNDRRNWDQPYFISTHNPDILFTGTHRVYKSQNGAIPNWEVISPDLTDGPKRPISDFLNQSISTLDQSPINPDVLYAATTDGNIWRTTTGGDTWLQLSGLPKRYFTEVVTSSTNPNTVFATVSGYKDNDNTPHIFKSEDDGDTWYAIEGNLPPLAINALKIIPNQEDKIMFVGTDGGVYGSMDGGVSWERVGTNMPIIAVYDLEWNEAENRLIAGTFARSVLSYSLEGIVSNTISSVSFEEKDTRRLEVFPNPVRDKMTVSFLNDTPDKLVQLSIYSIKGQLLKTVSRRAIRENNWQVEATNLPRGIYFLTVKGQNFLISREFLVLE